MYSLYNKKIYLLPSRIIFDPGNREHLLDYAEYLKYNNWKRTGCRFLLEDPFTDIPSMIRFKVISYFMQQYIDQV